jgi:outer membrane biosynthesis protein TonB
MEDTTTDKLLNAMASGATPELRDELVRKISIEPDGADILNAYQQDPQANRGAVEDLLKKSLGSSDNLLIQLLMAALQGGSAAQTEKEADQGGGLTEVIQGLAENILDEPKPKKKPKAKPKAKPKKKTQAKAKPKTKPKAKPKTKPKAKSKPKTKPKSSKTK